MGNYQTGTYLELSVGRIEPGLMMVASAPVAFHACTSSSRCA